MKVRGPWTEGPRKETGPQMKVKGPLMKVKGPWKEDQGTRSEGNQGPSDEDQGPFDTGPGLPEGAKGPWKEDQGPRKGTEGPLLKVFIRQTQSLKNPNRVKLHAIFDNFDGRY